MEKAVVAQKSPIGIDVEAGKTYWWCACGRSATQPFCDGSHKGTEFTPLAWKAGESGQVWFCCCKQTGNRPMCDGTHKRLADQA